MTIQQATALALLRVGCSYDDAAQSSGLSVEEVMLLWHGVEQMEELREKAE